MDKTNVSTNRNRWAFAGLEFILNKTEEQHKKLFDGVTQERLFTPERNVRVPQAAVPCRARAEEKSGRNPISIPLSHEYFRIHATPTCLVHRSPLSVSCLKIAPTVSIAKLIDSLQKEPLGGRLITRRRSPSNKQNTYCCDDCRTLYSSNQMYFILNYNTWIITRVYIIKTSVELR